MNEASAAAAATAAAPDRTPTDSQKAQALQTLAPGLYSSVSKLAASSKPLPFDRDFHFYNNFDEFKAPIQEIVKESQSVLQAIGSSASGWGRDTVFPEDLDDAYDWLVNVNDEVFERFDASVDEFQKLRKMEEESGKRIMDVDDGFQLVYGKKKKNSAAASSAAAGKASGTGELSSVKIASLRDKKVTGAKPKIPFHIPSIRRPQDEHNILVNNSNQPFQHVWLQRSEDEERSIHPLENLSVLDFVDKNVSDIKAAKPPPLEHTPFKFVTEVKDLKALAAKLRGIDEFAVDLEHNQYRSFQGLTCLIQISTRTEDFVIDALKLRIHIGPYLREVFKDPATKKVMHGADRDIIWLQRDFGIYVCNMFDTGQASRMLKLERNSLEHLLRHYCGVTANKEYQNADWRLRPLPEEMLRYGREDTHYLLYIYDLMRIELYSMSGQSDEALVEVYKRSSEICMQLYQKEIFTDSSYLHIYGLQGAGFNAQQLAIVAGLCEWRDTVARAEDESTGYILPNKTLIEIAKQMPVTTNKLQRIVKSKHSFIERYLGTVVSIIRHAMQNASAFEAAVEQLREARIEAAAPEEIQLVNEVSEADNLDPSPKQEAGDGSPQNIEDGVVAPSLVMDDPMEVQDGELPGKGEIKTVSDGSVSVSVDEIPLASLRSKATDANTSTQSSSNAKAGAAVQVLKKPSRGFGALFGSTGPKKKIETEKKDKEEKKLEQIRASVNLYFHAFAGKNDKPMEEEAVEPTSPLKKPDQQQPQEVASVQFNSSNADVIILDDDSDVEEEEEEASVPKIPEEKETQDRISVSSGMEETDSEDGEPMSLSDLSSSFQKCFDSMKKDGKSVKPFDYGTARKQVKFGEEGEALSELAEKDGNGGRKAVKGSAEKKKKNGASTGRSEGGGEVEFGQGRRRSAFPVTGNRSVTFR